MLSIPQLLKVERSSLDRTDRPHDPASAAHLTATPEIAARLAAPKR
jgi:hypothetical protein